MRLTIFLVLLTGAARAETPLTGEEFDALVTGRTLSFGSTQDSTYGVEMYLPGRRVIWSASPGTCVDGIWYESKGSICFRYEHDPEPQCWEIFDDPAGMRAVFTTRPGTTVIFEAVDNPMPLICDNLAS